MKDYFLKVWAKNMGAHYTWQDKVIDFTLEGKCVHFSYRTNILGKQQFCLFRDCSEVHRSTSHSRKQREFMNGPCG